MDKRKFLLGRSNTRDSGVLNIDSSNRSLSFVIISDDNGGTRYDWTNGEYYTEILDPTKANTERLTTFFKDHNHSVDSAIGKVENVRVEDGMLIADVTFGTDEVSDTIFRKYVDGILTDVSVGYEIKGYSVDEREGEADIVTVNDYEIFELSAVGIGFDKKAKKRGFDNMDIEKLTARIKELEGTNERNAELETELQTLRNKLADEKLAEKERKLAEFEAKEREFDRVQTIRSIAEGKGADELAETFIKEGKSVDEFRDALIDTLGKRTAPVTATPMSETEDAKRDLEDALVLRSGVNVEGASNFAHKLSRASLTDMAAFQLGMRNEYDKLKIVERAMLSGEFPLLLLNSGNRVLETEFDKQPKTYQKWIKEVDVQDFRKVTDIVRGGGGRLDRIGENGDLKERKLAEAGEEWKLTSFGNKFVITREMIINDDLGAFNSLLQEFAEAAALTANGLSYDLLRRQGDYAGYVMADGKSHYDTSRNNSGTVPLSAEALTEGIVAMSKQVSIDGVTKLNIKPAYLMVSMSDYFLASQLIGSTASTADNKNAGVINPLQGIVEIIVDSEIGDGEWYLAADRRTIKAGYLAGTGRRPQIKKNDSSIVRTEFEGVFDFGLVVEDYRGLYAGNYTGTKSNKRGK